MSASFAENVDNLFNTLESDEDDDRTECVSKVDHFTFYQYTIIPAVLISLAFSMLKTRRRKFVDFLYGRPALVHPMDALTTSASIPYIAAFGATTFLTYEVIFEQKVAFRYDGPLALKTLIVIVSMIWYGFVYFPVFASLAVKSIFSYGLGALYVWVITGIQFYKVFECDVRWIRNVAFVESKGHADIIRKGLDRENLFFGCGSSIGNKFKVIHVKEKTRLLLIGGNLPHLICLTYLSVILPIRFANALKTKKYFVAEETDLDVPQTLSYIRDSYQGVYVRKLLKKPKPKPPPPKAIKDKIKAGLLAAIHRILYKNEKGFRYSTRVLSVLMIGVFLLYVITFQILAELVPFIDMIVGSIHTEFNVDDLMPTEDEQFDINDFKTWIFVGYELLTSIKQCVIVSTALAVVVGMVMILHMLSSYRTNLLALYRGDHSHIPPRKDRSNASLMLGCMRFAGYQVGYIAWGFVIQGIIFFLLSLAISVIVILVQIGVSGWLVNAVLELWPIVVWTIVLNVLQLLLAKFLFAQGRGNTLYIDNRRFFFIFTYFMFFFNIFLGLVSCLMRIIKAIVLGALFMPRLDHSTLSQRFQFFDPGFAAYVGYMHVENQHTHPVMIVFIRLMLMNLHFRKLGESKSVDLNGAVRVDGKTDSSQCVSRKMKGDETDLKMVKEAKRRKYRATFNWAVFYTLINNPQIRVYRKGYIQSRMKAVEEGRRIPVSDLPVVDLCRLDSVSDTDDSSNGKDSTYGKHDVKGEKHYYKTKVCPV